MSHRAIAAVLARTDLAMGERLVALSLASFTNREERAFPGNAAAAARAGLGRSRYLGARDQLVARGLVAIEEIGRGRGRATTLIALFAQSGPWWDGEINARLLEQVLSHSATRGPARLLLATLAALADDSAVVHDLSTDELCRAAGLANSTYRRARTALLASGEVELVDDGGGRGHMNRWRVLAAAGRLTRPPVQRRRRQAPPPRQAPLLSTVRSEPTVAAAVVPEHAEQRPELIGVSETKGPRVSGVSVQEGPNLNGVCARKGPDLTGVSDRNPAKTPPETPPPHARAGQEPLNPRTSDPPSPPEEGRGKRWVTIDEDHIGDRRRSRRRAIHVDLNDVRRRLAAPSAADLAAWQEIRSQLQRRVGEDTFAIWLAPVQLIAVDAARRLVIAAPAPTAEWTSTRFGRVLATTAAEISRDVRFVTEAERRAIGACAPNGPIHINPKEAAG